jgi:hypothetical protein
MIHSKNGFSSSPNLKQFILRALRRKRSHLPTPAMPIAIAHSGYGSGVALASVSTFRAEQEDQPSGSARHHLQLRTAFG